MPCSQERRQTENDTEGTVRLKDDRPNYLLCAYIAYLKGVIVTNIELNSQYYITITKTQ